MSLPTSSQTATQFRICIILSDESVCTQLLAVNQSGAVIRSASTKRAYNSPESCILRLDECLRELGSDSESVNEVVFGLQPDWVVGNAMAQSKAPLLHKITTELSLQPVGFVVTTEAIVEHEIAQRQSFSGTVCVVNANKLFLLLCVQGSVIGYEQVGRSGNVGADMAEGIARQAGHLEPGTRFPDTLLLASLDLTDAQLQTFEQELLQVDWSTVDAVAQVPVLRTILQSEFMHIVGIGAGRAATTEDATALPADSEEMAVPAPVSTTLIAPDAGFQELEMTDSSKDELSDETAVSTATASATTASSFGIPISTDKLLSTTHNKKTKELLQELESAPIVKVRKYSHKHGVALGIVAGLLTLCIGYVVGALYFSKVVISVTPATKSISEDVDITLDPSITSTEPEKRLLAAKSLEKIIEGTDDILTTGVAIVGEKAVGTVKIFNKVQAEKSLPAGTVLKAGAQEFTLDAETTLASASAKESGNETIIKHSETTAKVTAKNIGAEGNVAENTKFSVGDFDASTYEAQAEKAFTGGASREVKVVSESDRKSLLESLTKKLVAEGTESLPAEVPEGTYVIPPLGYTIASTKFDSEVATEAERVSLTLSIKIQTLSYTAGDLQPIAELVLADKVPDGYELTDADPQILSSIEENKPAATSSAKTTVKLSAQVTSQAKPKLTGEQISAAVFGKKLDQARTALTSDERIKNSSLVITPSIFAPLVTVVPEASSRVIVTISE